MDIDALYETAMRMVAPGKGILAADESTGTIKKRFDTIKLESTADSRRDWREMLFRTEPAMSEHISGVILYDETLRQKAKDGTPLAELIANTGAVPGIKVDTGAKPLAGAPGEMITEGLDGLRERLAEYHALGARFAKWRAVINIGAGGDESVPSQYCINTNMHALARYAMLCQEAGIVPIVEPEVIMDGDHDIDRCYEVTEFGLKRLYAELFEQGVVDRLGVFINAADQLSRIALSGPVAGETFDYAYDPRGLPIRELSSQGRWDYGYGPDGRITSASGYGRVLDFGFDAAGNLLGAGRTYDEGNRLVRDDAFDYAYDANGNLVEKVASDGGARTVYSWDGRNRLVSVQRYASASASTPHEVRQYAYDAMGRRLTRSVDGVVERFLYDGHDRIGILDGSGTLLERVTFGPGIDAPLSIHGTHGPRYLHADRLGSVVAISDGAGGLQQYRYDPFGGTVSAPLLANDFRYTAREYEAEDLYYYRARYFDPQMGRFIGEDPIGLAGGLNLYAYAEGNPILYNDPMGECPWCIGAGIGFGIELFSQLARNGWNWGCLDAGGLLTATAMGAVGGGLGSRALTSGLRGLSNQAKGRVGEALSIAKNRLGGNRLIETQTRSIPNQRTIVDSTWRSRSGSTYYVESKFGTAGLTRAQREASRAVGDAYRVERWGYDFFGNVGATGGGIVGGGAGAAVSAAGDKDCGCK